jgi:RNA polymerase sigma-70 factor (ECF subfamily)
MSAKATDRFERAGAAELSAEAALIGRVLNGEKEAFYELIRPCERAVYMMAYWILQNESDAEDVAQEAILKAFRALRDFRRDAKFSTWLISITRNEARMKLRKQHRDLWESLDGHRNEDDTDFEPREFGDWREIPSEALERKEIRDLLAKAMTALSPMYREVLLLRDVRQMSIAETAELLGVGEGIVKTRLMRARLQLREQIAPVASVKGFLSRNLFRRGKKPWF